MELMEEQVATLTTEHIFISSLSEAVASIKADCLPKLETEFPEKDFPFHNLKIHFQPVAQETKTLLIEIQKIDPTLVTDDNIIMGELKGLIHDNPQEFNVNSAGTRHRSRGYIPENIIRPANQLGQYNEEKAADNLIASLSQHHQLDAPNPHIVDIQEIRRDIGATCPEPKFSFTARDDIFIPFTMTQPYAKDCSIQGLALALADLKRYGLSDIDVIDLGNREFRELEIGIYSDISAHLSDLSQIPLVRRAVIAEKILSWARSQPGFILGQKHDLDDILESARSLALTPKKTEIVNFITSRYSAFDTNARKCSDRSADLDQLCGISPELLGPVNTPDRLQKLQNLSLSDFTDLLTAAGYPIPPANP